MELLVFLAIGGAALALTSVLIGRSKAANGGDKYAPKEALEDAAVGFASFTVLVIWASLIALVFFGLYNLNQ